ncbi:MAG TPA: hypothetical protein VGB92_25175 [Longimicrobium sp.]
MTFTVGDSTAREISIVPGTNVQFSVDVPLNGHSKVRVEAVDEAGNVGSRAFSVVVDRTSPELHSLITPALTGAADAEFFVGGRDWWEGGYGRVVGANHRVNDGPEVNTQTLAAQSGEVLASASLREGSNTLRASAVDWAGNQSWASRGIIRSEPPVQVTAKGGHSCALMRSRQLYCWGDNTSYQLGASSAGRRSGVPVRVQGLPALKAVTAGLSHTCALDVEGYAYCWGTFRDYLVVFASWAEPRRVSETLRFEQISSGGEQSCGLTADGNAYCWGVNHSRQLGNGTSTSSMRPVAVHGGIRFSTLVAGWSSTCGIAVDDALYCWGSVNGATPVLAGGGMKFKSVSLGGSHACGVDIEGRGYCWGEAMGGRLGISGAGGYLVVTVPTEVSGGLRFKSIGAGSSHTCGLTVESEIYCWGEANHGRLGTVLQSSPMVFFESVPIRSLRGMRFESLSVGYTHACALSTSGGAYCWGREEHGELGNDP